jgi:hypothetical protein
MPSVNLFTKGSVYWFPAFPLVFHAVLVLLVAKVCHMSATLAIVLFLSGLTLGNFLPSVLEVLVSLIFSLRSRSTIVAFDAFRQFIA